MVENSDISVVVQGPIFGKSNEKKELRYTHQCIESIRKYLPGAEIILSTWSGSDTNDLDYDILVENEDPGKLEMVLNGIRLPYSVNRQIISTRNGILKSSRKYVFKLRSDIILYGDRIKKLYNKFKIRSKQLEILKERVITCNVSSFNPNKDEKRLFNPSDWIFFGLREDVYMIWDVPLLKIEDLKGKIGDNLYDQLPNISSEQYVWINLISGHFSLKLPYMRFVNDELRRISELSIANNLVIYSTKQLKFESFKYLNNSSYIKNMSYRSYYTHHQWKELYKKHCYPGLLLLPDIGQIIYNLRVKIYILVRELIIKGEKK